MKHSLSAGMLLCLMFSLGFGQPYTPDANTIALIHADEMSGVTAYDATPNHLDGTLGGSTSWSTGMFGGGFHFAPAANCEIALDGSTSYVEMADRPSLNFGSGDFTLECMIRMDNTGGLYDLPVLFKSQSSTIGGYGLQIMIGGYPQFFGSHNSVEWHVTATTPLTTGSWHHIAGVRSGNDYFLYVDGVPGGSSHLVVGSTDNNQPLHLGYWPHGIPARYFPGDLDEARVWSVARSAGEIAADAFLALTGNEGGLVGLWDFDDCSGTTVPDRSTAGNHGSLHGSYSYEPASWGPSSAGIAYVDMGSSALLKPSQLTVECWAKADSIRPSTMLIVTSAKDYQGYRLYLADGGKPAFDCQSGGSNIAMSPDAILPGEWHHLAGTFDGSTVRVYVDGALKASTAGSLSAATYPLFVGADVTPPFASDPFRGDVDEIRLSDVARAAFIETLTVVGPGFGDEWRITQPDASCVQWAYSNPGGTLRIDLLQDNSFVMNIADNVNTTDSVFCWTAPYSLAPGSGYQIYIESNTNSAVNDLGDPFVILPCGGLLGSDANTLCYYDFNECEGTIAHDGSGNGFDLALQDGAAWTPHFTCGCAADLSAATAKLSSPHIVGNGLNQFTGEAWIYATEIQSGTHHTIISRYSYYTSNPAYIFELQGNGALAANVYTTTGQAAAYTDSGLIQTDQWYHVAFAWTSGGHVRVFVDSLLAGSSLATLDGAINNSVDPLTVGWYHDTSYGNFYFQGYVDEVRLSNVNRYGPTLAVVGPGFGDEWRIGQYGAGVEWTSARLDSCIKIDLYRNGSFVTNISNAVPVEQDTLSWDVPCDIELGGGYQIYVESCIDATINDLGNPFLIREPYPADAVDDLVIQQSYPNALLNWSPVATDTLGNPLCPHLYLIYFESRFNETEDFLAWTTDTSYVHSGVMQFSPAMYYSVEVFIGTVATVAGAQRDLGPHFSRAEFHHYAEKQTGTQLPSMR
ncbi:hypothetical protein HZB60_02790 [candidate division KSB1 bacterium]|nr:hypothetical protein [candidate division KSB1 bacterium]